MSDHCKFCGARSVSWTMPAPGRWVLLDNGTGDRHRCHEWLEQRKPPHADRAGVFLRLYGPRKARTHALMVQTAVPEANTPRAMFDELEAEPRMPAYYHPAKAQK